ncbi:MAG: hypothetical protein HZB65_04015 [Candidatus Aenigmarchaeota archaeon]|nr:hypothetical protein [Candidatus Aenigmarchaeota archaeon]
MLYYKIYIGEHEYSGTMTNAREVFYQVSITDNFPEITVVPIPRSVLFKTHPANHNGKSNEMIEFDTILKIASTHEFSWKRWTCLSIDEKEKLASNLKQIGYVMKEPEVDHAVDCW